MTAYKFNPGALANRVDWNTPTYWLPAVTPNAADADVVIPLITSNGSPYDFNVTVTPNESFAVRSLSVGPGQTLNVNGKLAVSGTLAISGALSDTASSQIGTLSDAGSTAFVSGILSSPNAIQNDGYIYGGGTINVAGFTNTGTLNGVTLSTPGGAFTNLVNGMLSGGTYEATDMALMLSVHGDITADAATIVVGASGIETLGPTGTLDSLGNTLRSVAAGGVLMVTGAYRQTIPLVVSGSVKLAYLDGNGYGAIGLDSAGVTVALGGVVQGAGTITGPVAIQAGGLVQATKLVIGTLGVDQGGTLILTGPVSGPGTLAIQATPEDTSLQPGFANLNTLELAGVASSDVTFGDYNGTLKLDSPSSFSGRIHGFVDGLDGYTDLRTAVHNTYEHSATVLLGGIALDAVNNYFYTGDGASGTLTLKEADGGSVSLNFAGDYTTLNFNLTAIPQSLSSAPPVLSITYNIGPHHPAAQDFNGDGTSDLVLQNDTGPIVLLTTQNLGITGSYSFGNPGGSWHAVGIADFDGNGTPDVLFQNDNGAIVDYLTTGGAGTQVAGGFLLDNPGSSWHVRGTGDFNGDGKADIVLQNDSGLIVVDYTNGGAVIGRDVISNPGPAWTVEAVGDLNADGHPDLLLQNTNGALVDFLMIGATPVAGYLLSSPGTGYSVAGIGDYNTDGFGDIVLHNDNGTDVVVDTRGQVVSGTSAPVGNPGATWTNVTAGIDLNGDGTSDLVLANQNGTFVGVDVNAAGTGATISATLTNPGPGWRSVGGTPIEFIDGTGPTLAPLTGTPGADEFNLTSIGVTGLHTINGFDPAIDLLALSAATFPNYAAVQAVEQPYMGGTFVALPNASGVLLAGIDPSQVTAANFVLR